MLEDLKIIRQNYGPSFMFMCKELFSDILKENGLLSAIILNHFNPNKNLYNDLIKYNKINEFRDYIYELYNEYKSNIPTPNDIFNSLGYDFYECTNPKDLDYFTKYFSDGESIKIFNNREEYLSKNNLFIAIKKDIDNIKREKFRRLNKIGKYSTSLMFLSYSKNIYNTLTITGRYGDKYVGYNNLYNNNLEQIHKDLPKSFNYYYNLGHFNKNNFNMPGYVYAKDGKYYKYNYEINGVYYCPNNMIIDTFDIKYLDSNKYILLDYFILDLESKYLYLYDTTINDGFSDLITKIYSIEYSNNIIKIILNNEEYINIYLDYNNNIIRVDSDTTRPIKDNFLRYNNKLKEINLKNVRKIGKKFLYNNEVLNNINLDNIIVIDDYFLYNNRSLEELNLESVKIIGHKGLYNNNSITKVNIPIINLIGKGVLKNASNLEEINIGNNAKIYEPSTLVKAQEPKSKTL